jgi:hypothetical protein
VAVVAACFVLVMAGACGSGDDGVGLVLDGRARPPDAEGVVTDVSRDLITLDGDRAYAVSPDLQSFSTATLEPLPVLGRRDQYVHLGLNGNTAVWIAAVGGVLPGDPALAYYEGTVAESSADRVVFEDGTVLRLASGVAAPDPGEAVFAEIDVGTRRVRALTVQRNAS